MRLVTACLFMLIARYFILVLKLSFVSFIHTFQAKCCITSLKSKDNVISKSVGDIVYPIKLPLKKVFLYHLLIYKNQPVLVS